MAQAPEQTGSVRFGGQEQVLEVLQLEFVGGLGEGGQRLRDAQVGDEARIDGQDLMRTKPMKAEPPRPALRDGFELAADAVAPRLVHPERRRVGGKEKSRRSPRFVDDLPLDLELVRVSGVLKLTPATF